ncbi:MAG: carbamoyltransferase C-terminal domain-containing protein [Pirellulales bacterium]
MRVLGLSPLDKDSTATFMEDGHVVFACAEERLSRVKLQDGFPSRAVKLGFEWTGWDPASIDVVTYAFYDGAGEASRIQRAFEADRKMHHANATRSSLQAFAKVTKNGYHVDRRRSIPGFTSEDLEFMPRKSWHKRLAYGIASRFSRADWSLHSRYFRKWAQSAAADHHLRTAQLSEGLAQFGLAESKLRRFDHHDTHAANAFYGSGFDEALVVTFDGYGSGNCGGIYVGDAAGIKPLHKFAFPNSLGHFYEHVTSALGFRPNRHEGKIVGLAAYGDPSILRDVLWKRFQCENGDIRMLASMNYLFTRSLAQHFAKRDVAAAYQRMLEEVGTTTVRYWLKKTGLRKVAMSGGVHANVKFNQRIREIEDVDEVFIYPNMGDGGCGTGAAMLAFGHDVMYTRRPINNVYYGPAFSDSQIEASLRREGLAFDRLDDVEDRVAQLLSENRIVGRFHGRMEYGPRALGNRSVLYPAKDPEVNQWLNHQLGRTEFMPFAPSAMASEAHRLFRRLDGCEKASEFMTITFDCTDDMQQMCPAAVHIDGTARPQIVHDRNNASYHKILRGYYERTGVPAIINTSFNMHEEPIVCTPYDAVRAFLDGNLDYLAAGPFVAAHPRLTENVNSRMSEAQTAVG